MLITDNAVRKCYNSGPIGIQEEGPIGTIEYDPDFDKNRDQLKQKICKTGNKAIDLLTRELAEFCIEENKV